MSEKTHHYETNLKWTGNQGEGTGSYRSYKRDHTISIPGKPDIPGSSDPAFRGDPSRHNPEELLVASLSACHMLWYLHLCASHKIVVLAYEDQATGEMVENADGSGRFKSVTLHPYITLADPAMKAKAETLHEKANQACFIANSCNFPVHHQAIYRYE